MADTTLPALLGTGAHAARPAAGDVGSGALFSCTDHDLVYQSDGSSWTTWATLGTVGGAAQVPWSIAPEGGAWGSNVRALGVANRAVYAPCTIPADCTITGMRLRIGVQSGNICVGLYDSAGARVATSGSVACPAVGNSVTVAFTAGYAATAGRYYLALSADNNTATFAWCESAAGGMGPATSRFEASAFPLPATATFSQPISTPAIIGIVSGGHP